jgi:hypothetical protein
VLLLPMTYQGAAEPPAGIIIMVIAEMILHA